MRLLIEKGLLEGRSVKEIANSLEKEFYFSRRRARRIARTESTKAINAASAQAYSTAQAQGINIRKQWLSADDDLVRETHAGLDGDVVDANDDFRIGTHTAPSPAMFGVEAEDINCRCTIIPVIDE